MSDKELEGLQEFLNMFGNAVGIILKGHGSSATMHITIDGVDIAVEIKKDTSENRNHITVKDGTPWR